MREAVANAQPDPADEIPESVLMAGAVALEAQQAQSTPSSTQQLMQELLMDELAERRRKRQQAEDELRKLMLARTQGYQEEQKRREQGQAFCNHRKENMKPNIGGQRLSNNEYIFICQTCYKTWDGKTLPPTLQIGMEHIGG